MKRISGLIYEETRGVLKEFLENVCTNHQASRCCAAADSPAGYPRHRCVHRTWQEVRFLVPITFGTTAHIRILNNQENCYLTRRGLRPQAFWTHPLRLRRLKEYPYIS